MPTPHASPTRILLGLGNPGSRYAATRHNIGWMALDAVAQQIGVELQPGRGDYWEAIGVWRGQQCLLAKPTTYMNNSGEAATQLLERYRRTPADLLVVVDEFQFPVGKIQIKSSGSSGGHNGLESLIYHLGTRNFPRLRCGIGRDFRPGQMADYVLSPFPAEQQPAVQQMLLQARDAMLDWVIEGTERAMILHNNVQGRSDSGEVGNRTQE
ncbi:MAG: aminoacyl-tRNA hydrolase [Armatimonadetes bacterium]|nr:aminoacyl-tRNA hydrolase [Armatimonadota bacterium]